jgi:hypothetical protein
MLQVARYVRKPFVVQAVQVTEENMEEVASWCDGKIEADPQGKKYIKVNVTRPMNDRQTMAFSHNWVLLAENGYKVFLNKPFLTSYEEFIEPRCGSTTTADGLPCVLGAGHRSHPVATGCRSLQDYKVIMPTSPLVRQVWVDPNLECV